MALTVKAKTSRQEGVAALLRQSDAVAERLYPSAYRRPLNPEPLAMPGITVFVARDESGRRPAAARSSTAATARPSSSG